MGAAAARINAADLLLAGDAGRTALVCGDQRISYGELRSAVALAGAAWLDCEVRTGELVLLRAMPDIEHAVAFLGAIWAGAVPMPVAAPPDHLARHPHVRVRFVLDLTREGHADRWRDQVMTLAEWRMYLGLSRPAEALRLPADAAACWTEGRRQDAGGARLLAHCFALGSPSAASRIARAPVSVSGVSGMLQALRRGGTAVLCARAAGTRGARVGARAELALP